MTEQMLIQELKERGNTNITVRDVVKNGVRLRGLTIRQDDSRIAPCVYINDFLTEYDDDDAAIVADIIENTIAANSSVDLGCDIESLTDKDFIKSRVYIGLQKASDQPLIKRPSMYDEIEQYLYIRGVSDNNGRWSVKLNDKLIGDINIDELWQIAEAHTFAESQICSMSSALSDIFDEDCFSVPEDFPLYIITNTNKVNGAACACDIEHIRSWAHEKGFARVCLLPSSTHEMLILGADENTFNLDELSNLVKEVNSTQVRPEEQLADRAYLIDVA